jgi:putative acetyltransferase
MKVGDRSDPVSFSFGVINPMRIKQASTPDEIALARQLFEEYEAGLGISLCFQNFQSELAGLPGKYAPPDGRLLLAFSQDELAGCIALRQHDATTCEMKRLFIRPAFRGSGLGKELVNRIIQEARSIGYQRMCLDTLSDRMQSALKLYRSLGFNEISPYYDNPVEGATFMELKL